MSTNPSPEGDERTVAVENAGSRWANIFLSYALLIDVVYRGMVRHEAAWDLLALVIVSGFICMVYQARQKALAHDWVMKGLLIMLLGAVIGLASLWILFKIVPVGSLR